MSKQEFAYRTVRERILDGTYTPGYRLIISQLAREFSTSAIPIREALRQLEAERLIEYKQFSGAVVTPVDERQYVDTLKVFAVLLGFATALSVPQFPEQQIRKLEALNRQMKQALEDFDFHRFGQLNRRFHELSIQSCDNEYLLKTIEEIQNRIDSIRRTGSTFFGVRARESVEEHDQIISLFKEKVSPGEVEQFVRKHVCKTAEVYRARKEGKGIQNPF
ncbi:MAG: GntR family transcriptional regulator [Bacillaceae bacterium]|nr:GntR family transcriptional regulator [Bacillaceae bacterium]